MISLRFGRNFQHLGFAERHFAAKFAKGEFINGNRDLGFLFATFGEHSDGRSLFEAGGKNPAAKHCLVA